jgi:hypothetical protein
MITLKDDVQPEFLQKIDRKNNIILCVPPTDHCVLESNQPDILSVILTQELNLSNAETISQNVVSINYKPRLKLSVPAGIKMNMIETESGNLVGIFDKIYKSMDEYVNLLNDKITPSHTIYENLALTLYIDVIQLRKKLSSIYIKKNQSILDIYFSWYIQTNIPTPNIENVYLIKDLYIFQEFRNII